MQRRLFITGAAAAIVTGGAFIYTELTPSNLSGFARANAQEAANIDTSGIIEMALGDPDAPVTMIEYASFTCPHCANFHKDVMPRLKADYIDTGKVRFIYREVYFDRFGLWAAMLARCGGEERYFGIADILYEEQREWLDGDDPSAIAENLRRIGRRAGLSDETMNACFEDAEQAQAMVALYQQQAEADDINSTPSFVIDGEKYPNMSYADMQEVLDEALS